MVISETGEPISFASIVNLNTKHGTISNVHGEFSISAHVGDSVLLTFVGYQRQVIRIADPQRSLSITLHSAPQLLQEITVRASDNRYLYEIFQACRKNEPKKSGKSKAYFELKSFTGDRQTELLECYYNAAYSGYKLDALDMKAGRFGMQFANNRLFTSIDASAALRKLDIFTATPSLPANPFSLSSPLFRKIYYLDVVRQYLNDQRDSMIVIRAIPRDSSGHYFETIAELNVTRKLVKRVQLFCQGAASLPFRPLFSMDSIRAATMNINLTYTDAPVRLQHIDFRYQVDYKSRNELTYTVNAQSVLYCYDHDNPFVLPWFEFADPGMADYRKIGVIAYHDAFWTNQDFRPGDRYQRNQQFYSDTNTITNVSAYGAGSIFGYKRMFQHPYVTWSGDRVRLNEIMADTIANTFNEAELTASKYDISVKLYLDINQWDDTLRVTTRAILDPYETYWRLPLDTAAQCAINMFFDIAEIERRELEKEVLACDGSPETIQRLYDERVHHLEEMKLKFWSSVNRGTDITAMEAANAVILGTLGIDNMKVFAVGAAVRDK